MREPERAEVEVTCDCGHRHSIAFAAIRAPVTCPACGHIDTFDQAQIARIERAFGLALEQASRGIAEGASRAVGEASTRRE